MPPRNCPRCCGLMNQMTHPTSSTAADERWECTRCRTQWQCIPPTYAGDGETWISIAPQPPQTFHKGDAL